MSSVTHLMMGNRLTLWCQPPTSLTLSWRRPLSYRNQSTDLRSKSMDWFLYDNGLRYERVNNYVLSSLMTWYCSTCFTRFQTSMILKTFLDNTNGILNSLILNNFDFTPRMLIVLLYLITYFLIWIMFLECGKSGLLRF